MGDLQSLSVPLWIMAVVSVLQALVLIGAGVAGYLAYARVMTLVNDLEARQIAPLREKVEGILGDVKAVTARVNSEAERVRAGVHEKVNQVAGVVRGVRAVIMSLLHKESHT